MRIRSELAIVRMPLVDTAACRSRSGSQREEVVVEAAAVGSTPTIERGVGRR
jgi:hypothetical protein